MIARGKAEKKAARTARLSAALRENLKRRKAQARGRAEAGDAASRQAGQSDNAAPVNAPNAPQTPDFRRNRGNE